MEGVPGNRFGVGGIEIGSPIQVVWAWSPDDFVLFDLVGAHGDRPGVAIQVPIRGVLVAGLVVVLGQPGEALVRTYFRLGRHHIRFNAVDTETLRETQAHPDVYRDLPVRVTGYRDYFVDTGRNSQEDIVVRTMQGVL